ncbi:hypothetical protein A5643_05110 [Mycobacterium sp. 1274756.6]|nr:hypothetical protein A5643_05110 [Mycobacterium sp. 1274756.6]
MVTALPESHLVDIQLTALSDLDPISPVIDLFGNTFGNIAAIGEGVLDNGAPALTQFLTNQLGYGTTLLGGLQGAVTGTLAFFLDDQPGLNLGYFLDGMIEAISGGDFLGAGSTFDSGMMTLLFSAALPLLPAAQIPGEIVQNLANVVGDVGSGLTGSLLAGGISALSPVFATVQAIFASMQAISDAAGPLESLGALINTPTTLADAFLNGWDNMGAITPGLFTPLLPGGAGIGPLAFLAEGIPQIIAGALGGDATGGLTGFMSEFADTAMAVPEQLVNSITGTLGNLFDAGTFTNLFDIGALTTGMTDLFNIGDFAGLTDLFTMFDPMAFIEPLLAMLTSF